MSKLRIVQRPIFKTSAILGNTSPLLQRLYLARGVSSEKELQLSLDQLLPTNGLGGVTTAVNLLATAIEQNWSIVVVGDYDADGATASAVSILILQALGGQQVGFIIPDRFTMGYGLAPELVELAATRGAKLILTVDSGITSLAGVARAQELGIKVIVTDHHLPGSKLPDADAIVNPNVPGD